MSAGGERALHHLATSSELAAFRSAVLGALFHAHVPLTLDQVRDVIAIQGGGDPAIPDVKTAARQLFREGLVQDDGQRLLLTERGTEIALGSVRRARLRGRDTYEIHDAELPRTRNEIYWEATARELARRTYEAEKRNDELRRALERDEAAHRRRDLTDRRRDSELTMLRNDLDNLRSEQRSSARTAKSFALASVAGFGLIPAVAFHAVTGTRPLLVLFTATTLCFTNALAWIYRSRVPLSVFVPTSTTVAGLVVSMAWYLG